MTFKIFLWKFKFYEDLQELKVHMISLTILTGYGWLDQAFQVLLKFTIFTFINNVAAILQLFSCTINNLFHACVMFAVN